VNVPFCQNSIEDVVPGSCHFPAILGVYEQETRKIKNRRASFFMGASLLNQIKNRNILPQS
jgi:hypothetical protein